MWCINGGGLMRADLHVFPELIRNCAVNVCNVVI